MKFMPRDMFILVSFFAHLNLTLRVTIPLSGTSIISFLWITTRTGLCTLFVGDPVGELCGLLGTSDFGLELGGHNSTNKMELISKIQKL